MIKKLGLILLLGIGLSSFGVTGMAPVGNSDNVFATHECGGPGDWPSQAAYDACVANSDHGPACEPGDFDPTVDPEEITFDADPDNNCSLQPVGLDELNIENNPIYRWLLTIVNFLSVGVGIVATISVAIAGFQYATARGNPGQTQKAVERLTQAGVAIFLYVFGYAFLNWLIPGGVF